MYGDVITEHYSKIVGMFENGKIPEELEEIFKIYFDILYGQIEDEE